PARVMNSTTTARSVSGCNESNGISMASVLVVIVAVTVAVNKPRSHPENHHSSGLPKRALIHENAIVPPPITAHVATVRHKMSVPVNSQMASRDAATATKMHRLVVQKENPLTTCGSK